MKNNKKNMLLNNPLLQESNFITVELKQKLLNKVYFNKGLIRNSFINTKKIKLIDNQNSFDLLNSSSLKKKIISGYSLAFQKETYSHLTKPSLSFQKNSSYFNTELKNNFFDNSLIFFEKSTSQSEKFKDFLIIKPIKGGFLCFFMGFIGFLPFSHYCFALNAFYINLDPMNYKNIMTTSNFLLNQYNNYVLRLSFMNLNPSISSTNFINRKNRARRKKSLFLFPLKQRTNFVFLTFSKTQE